MSNYNDAINAIKSAPDAHSFVTNESMYRLAGLLGSKAGEKLDKLKIKGVSINGETVNASSSKVDVSSNDFDVFISYVYENWKLLAIGLVAILLLLRR